MNNVTRLSTSTSPLPESWIEKMFDKMLLDYGKKFTDQWAGSDPDKLIRHWAHEMASYTGPEISRGLAAMESRDWPPSLPEFKKMCRPPVDEMAAYYEALAGLQAREKGEIGSWSHPAIFWAAAKMTFDLKNQTYSQCKPRWERVLQEQMDKSEWHAIPAPMLALAEPGQTKLSKEKAAQVLNEIGAADVLKPKTDHKLWAKRIIERAKKPNHGLSAIQIRFAKEALEVRERAA